MPYRYRNILLVNQAIAPLCITRKRSIELDAGGIHMRCLGEGDLQAL